MSAPTLERPPTCDGCIEPTPATWRYKGDRAAPTNLCAPHADLWMNSVDRDPRNYEQIGDVR